MHEVSSSRKGLLKNSLSRLRRKESFPYGLDRLDNRAGKDSCPRPLGFFNSPVMMDPRNRDKNTVPGSPCEAAEMETGDAES
jgi:hypothetical protein